MCLRKPPKAVSIQAKTASGSEARPADPGSRRALMLPTGPWVWPMRHQGPRGVSGPVAEAPDRLSPFEPTDRPMKHIHITVAVLALVLAGCGQRPEAETLAEAKTALAAGDSSTAVVQLKSLLAESPDSAAARLLLARALVMSGDPGAALIELRKAQDLKAPDDELVPELARLMLILDDSAGVLAQFTDKVLSAPGAVADLKATLAAAAASRGQMDLAREQAMAALTARPDHVAAAVVLARLDALQGKTDEALRRLDGLLAAGTAPDTAALLKADLLLRVRKDPDAAMKAYRQALASHPKSVLARVAVINLLVEQRQVEQARAEFELLQKTAPRHPDTLFLQAQFLFADKNYPASREIHERLLTAMPGNTRVLVAAAGSEYQMGHFPLAVALLGRALKVEPTHLLARQLLAQSYLRMSLPDKALEALQPVVDQATADAASLALAGEAFLQSGDSKRSEALLQRAAQLAPADRQVRTSLALLQASRGQGMADQQLQALAKDWTSTRADLALISLRLRNGQHKEALQAIDNLQAKRAQDPIPHVLRGRVLALDGDSAAARASFEQALAKAPHHLPALDGLVALDVRAGQVEQARQRLQSAVKAQPDSVRLRVALAEFEGRMGASDATVASQLKDAIKIDPLDPAPRLALVERLLASGDGVAAEQAAQEGSAALPDNLALLGALGRAQILARQPQRAVSTFKRLAAQQPREPQHQLLLADAYREGNDLASAEAALRKALSLQPDNLFVQRALAVVAMLDKRPQDGVAIARSVQKRLPKEAIGFAIEGEVEAGARNWPAAATAYAAALQRGRSSELAMRLHRSLVEAGRAADADRMAAQWQATEPKDSAFVYYLGSRHLTAKDWPNAEVHFRKVLSLQPRHAAAMNNLAWVMAVQKKPGAALLAEQANAITPDRAPVLDTWAMALEADNQLPKAVDVQRQAVALAPQDPALRLRLARLLIKQGLKSDARAELDTLARLGSSFAEQSDVKELLKSL